MTSKANFKNTAGVLSALFINLVPANGALVGLWNFDGDFTNEIGGGANIDPSNDVGNSPGSFLVANIDGSPATVLDYFAAPSGSFFTVSNDAASNGGGSGTNNYSFAFDFMVDDVSGGFTSLLQTNTFAGDVDLFVRPTGALDMSFGATDSAAGLISSGQWNRVVLTREAGATFQVYLNGVSVLTHSAFGVDDADYRIDGEIRPFSDNSGETNDIQINSFAYWDETLTPTAVSSLGGANAGGIPIPEPGSSSLVFLSMLGTCLFRRRK